MTKLKTILLAILMLAPGYVFADVRAEVKAVMIANFDALLTFDSKAFAATTAADVTIVDEFPPFYWSGPTALAKYNQGFKEAIASMKLSNLTATVKDAVGFEQNNNTCYAVFPVTIKSTGANGKAHTEDGYQTAIFEKNNAGKWVIKTTTWSVIKSDLTQ